MAHPILRKAFQAALLGWPVVTLPKWLRQLSAHVMILLVLSIVLTPVDLFPGYSAVSKAQEPGLFASTGTNKIHGSKYSNLIGKYSILSSPSLHPSSL